MDPIALRLVCHGTDEHPLRLTRTATLHTQGLDSLVDGTHRAVHVGQDADRDVYRVGESMVLKLCAADKERRSHSNQREAAALQATQHLRQTPRLFFEGDCAIEVFEKRRGNTDSITLMVSCLLASYEGPSLDCLMHTHLSLPYSLTTAFFFLSAYQELVMMAIDGVAEQVSYTDVHTANVATLGQPTQYVLGERVPVVILDATEVVEGKLPRSVFNAVLDSMFSDIVSQCHDADDESWHFFGRLISHRFNRFFRQNGDKDLDHVRLECLDRFQCLRVAVSKTGHTASPELQMDD
jgi:hypothetical protein